MDWPATLIVVLVASAFTAFCGWRGSRPPDLRRGPRLIPWRFLMILGATAAILMLAHLAGVVRGGAGG